MHVRGTGQPNDVFFLFDFTHVLFVKTAIRDTPAAEHVADFASYRHCARLVFFPSVFPEQWSAAWVRTVV